LILPKPAVLPIRGWCVIAIRFTTLSWYSSNVSANVLEGYTVQLLDLKARIERLNALTTGLAKEVVRIREGTDPLLYLERKGYMAGLHDAIRGLEDARVMLAQVVFRIEDGQR
jgi:hypothetical protein